MLLAREILGVADEPRFAGRRVERLPVPAVEAGRRRLRRDTDRGTDVAVDLPAGRFLADGAVLADDGERIVVVRRPPEPALVVRLDLATPPEELLDAAVRLGHAFGNQHVPVEVDGAEVRVHLTTSAQVAEETVQRLGLRGARIEHASVPLSRHRPAARGHAH